MPHPAGQENHTKAIQGAPPTCRCASKSIRPGVKSALVHFPPILHEIEIDMDEIHRCECCPATEESSAGCFRKLTRTEMVRLGLLQLRGARYMCPPCYLANKRTFEWSDRCLSCGMRRRLKQWMGIPPRMKEFFLLVCPGADRISRDCYNDVTLFLEEGRVRDWERWSGLQAAVVLLRDIWSNNHSQKMSRDSYGPISSRLGQLCFQG